MSSSGAAQRQAAAALVAGAQKEAARKPVEGIFQADLGGRVPCLDGLRVFCIWLACVSHGGTDFGAWNVLFVQAWVRQYLFLISGVCFAIASPSLPLFLARLGLYFFVGVACNACAWYALGLDVSSDLEGVIFQFWFVAALALFAVLLAPLRLHLRWLRESLREGESARGVGLNTSTSLLLASAGAALIAAAFSFVLIPLAQALLAKPLSTVLGVEQGPQAVYKQATVEDANAWLRTWLTHMQLGACNLFLMLAFPAMSRKVGLVGWLLLASTYIHRVLLCTDQYIPQESRAVNGFWMMMLGLVCQFLGLSGRRVVGDYMIRYWFVLFFCCALCWPQGTVGRLDEFPSMDFVLRARCGLLELICVVLFLAAGERMVDPAIFAQDRMDYLGTWAFVLFMVHKAAFLLVPEPLNWALLVSLAYPCWKAHDSGLMDLLGAGGSKSKRLQLP